MKLTRADIPTGSTNGPTDTSADNQDSKSFYDTLESSWLLPSSASTSALTFAEVRFNLRFSFLPPE